jgi:hypothetical protein
VLPDGDEALIRQLGSVELGEQLLRTEQVPKDAALA